MKENKQWEVLNIDKLWETNEGLKISASTVRSGLSIVDGGI